MFLGIEIGGTKLQLGVGTGDGSELIKLVRHDIDARRGAAAILDAIERSARPLIEQHRIDRIGIGFGGPVDSAAGIVTKSHQVAGWDNFPLARWCQETLGRPAVIGNDCDVAALAEAHYGAGRGANSVFYVTVGTGIGGGLVLGGQLHGSGRPAASEIGHLRPGLAADQPDATVESLASGPAIAAAAAARLGNLEGLTAKSVADLAAAGNPLAREVIAGACQALGWAIAQVITLVAPEIIVIGGGVSLIGDDLFFHPLRHEVACYVFPPLANSYKIVPAALGELAVVHGAITLALTPNPEPLTPAPLFLTLRHLLEMIRFSHTLFALPFALLAALMAWTTPLIPHSAFRTPHSPPPAFHWSHLLGILLCMVAARSAAMAFNRLADRRLDAANPRTKMRHLPAGTLSVTSVTIFTLVSSIAFITGTLLFLPNWLPLALSIPFLLFLLGYSFAKRFTSLAHFWLGMALLLAPVSAWIALRGQILLIEPLDLLPALILGGAVLTWVAGFDIIYACQDATFDRQAQLKSVPAALGVLAALRVAALCHFATLLLLIALPLACPQVPLGWIYASGVAIVAALLIYEHLLVRPDDLTRVNIAFFNINAVISLGLLIVGAIDLLT